MKNKHLLLTISLIINSPHLFCMEKQPQKSLPLTLTHRLTLESQKGEILATSNRGTQLLTNAMKGNGFRDLALVNPQTGRSNNVSFEDPAWVAKYNPNDEQIAVGCGRGSVEIINAKRLYAYNLFRSKGHCSSLDYNKQTPTSLAVVSSKTNRGSGNPLKEDSLFLVDTRSHIQDSKILTIKNNSSGYPVAKFHKNYLAYGGDKIVKIFDTRKSDKKGK